MPQSAPPSLRSLRGGTCGPSFAVGSSLRWRERSESASRLSLRSNAARPASPLRWLARKSKRPPSISNSTVAWSTRFREIRSISVSTTTPIRDASLSASSAPSCPGMRRSIKQDAPARPRSRLAIPSSPSHQRPPPALCWSWRGWPSRRAVFRPACSTWSPDWARRRERTLFSIRVFARSPLPAPCAPAAKSAESRPREFFH